MGDSVLRQIISHVNLFDGHVSIMVNCLLVAKLADITHCPDSLVGSAGEESVVMVYVGTNGVGKYIHEVLEA